MDASVGLHETMTLEDLFINQLNHLIADISVETRPLHVEKQRKYRLSVFYVNDAIRAASYALRVIWHVWLIYYLFPRIW